MRSLWKRASHAVEDFSMNEYTLVVVDMQSNFEAANDPTTIKNVEREVRTARQRGCAVLLLRIPYWSPMDEQGMPYTHKSISDIVAGYDKAGTGEKLMWQDGACNVENLCAHYGFKTDKLRVVGVNTAGCVWALVNGLIERLSACEITVVKDACNSAFGLSQGKKCQKKWDDSMWSFFAALRKVTLDEGGATAGGATAGGADTNAAA